MKELILAVSFFVIFTDSTLGGASLVGTTVSLQKQNSEADREKLVRIRDDHLLDQMKKEGILVGLPETIRVDLRLDKKWQWCLPQTANFLEDLGLDFVNKFGRFLQVNSAVRTIARQMELILINGNAAPVGSDRMSPHLTGATIDIAKKKMSKQELEWMRHRLLELEDLNLIEATEEWDQLCFHVMVFDTYLGKNRVPKKP